MEPEHGTMMYFCWGCRCPECDARCPHGTRNGYVNYFCRCDECRQAAQVYGARKRIQWKIALGKPLSALEQRVKDEDAAAAAKQG